MGWQRGKYYVKSRRIGTRVTTEYVGTGETALLIAQLDALDRERRDLARADAARARAQFRAQVKAPAALTDYRAAVRELVADVLGRLGYHQHKRGEWRYTRMATEHARARELLVKRTLTTDERGELRAILTAETGLTRQYGDMANVAWRCFMAELDKQSAGLGAAVDVRRDLMRRAMDYDGSSELERLLIDEVVLCQFDYYRVERAYATATAETFTLPSMEQWNRVLEQKQTQYLRAVLALARVRRLLRLPAMQVNIGQTQVIGDGTVTSYLP